MTRKLVGVVVCAWLVMGGCASGGAAVAEHPHLATRVTQAALTTGSSTTATEASETTVAAPSATSTTPDVPSLPVAPWAGPHLSANEAPRPLLAAWESAENRDSCAPIASSSLGVASGARARTSELSGGWLVELDRPGLPGIDRQGRECDTCGRSVVGIAGTSVSPEALLVGDDDTLAPTYSDGSHAETEFTEADGEHVASITFTVPGQSCVYEVWSLLGPEHLQEVVAGLRIVDPPVVRGGALARAGR